MPSAMSSSAKGATFLILIQLCSRASTFIVNQLLLRYLSPSLLGISTQLELYSISVLYFARESLRVALQRQSSNGQAVVNLSYLSIATGLPLSLGLGWLYTRSPLPDVPHMHDAIALYGFAAMIELLSETCFVVVQQKLAYGIRASAETSATIARCFVTYGAVYWSHKQTGRPGLLSFAYGQLAYATVLLLVYLARVSPIARQDKISLWPRKMQSSTPSEYIMSLFSRPLCTLGLNLYLQSAIKYILTQGDSLLIAALASLEDQGAYALASNYGGLIARVLFQPIEESSRNLFAKLCAEDPAPEANESRANGSYAGNEASGTVPEQSTKGSSARPSANIMQAQTILMTILHLYLLLALVSASIGPSIAPVGLSILAGNRWASTTAGSVLSAYTYYIPLLALNGVSEAFVAAVASNTELQAQSVAMGFYSVAFAGAAYLTLSVAEMGATGLVLANCVNMACRIVWNAWFIKSFFGRRGVPFTLNSILPATGSIAAAVAIGAALRADRSAYHFFASPVLDEISWHVAGAGSLGVVLLVCERHFLIGCYQMVTRSRA